jgi:hypothetical protein
MSFSFDASINVPPLSWSGVFPQPPGAGKGQPFELRAGAWYQGELKVVRLRGRERINDIYRYDVSF